MALDDKYFEERKVGQSKSGPNHDRPRGYDVTRSNEVPHKNWTNARRHHVDWLHGPDFAMMP
jgi:hypothetical protein